MERLNHLEADGVQRAEATRVPRVSVRQALPFAPGSARTLLSLQRSAGNRAVGALVREASTAPVQRDPTDRMKKRMETGPKSETRRMGETGLAKRRAALASTRARAKQDAAGDRRGILPSVEFTVRDSTAGVEEKHTVYADVVNARPILMISSIPLPVAAFILGMDARFTFLLSEGRKARKMPKWFTTREGQYPAVKVAADTALAAADLVFATVTSTVSEKRSAETALAAALHALIQAVLKMSSLLGSQFAKPGLRPPGTTMEVDALGIPKPESYVTFLRDAPAKYDLEGLMAQYKDMPDYEASGFERDHQPHNDIIEKMAKLPEFTGRKIQQVAAGRTQQGWAIMLHHNRHMLGRTFSAKGGKVTQDFVTDLAGARGGLATATDVRAWCINYLVESMKKDVDEMNAVVAREASFGDLPGPGANAAMRAKIKTQVEAGEDRILATEDSIRTYGNT